MRLDRLTTKTREALMAAQQIAAEMGNPELYPEHLVLALLVQEGGLCKPVVEKSGADAAALTDGINKRLAAMPKVEKTTMKLKTMLMDAINGPSMGMKSASAEQIENRRCRAEDPDGEELA